MPSYQAKHTLSSRHIIILALASILSLGCYLLISGCPGRCGFPLDDAWIHQTYARNLATIAEWSFIPGIPSGGSTSPLWSGLLAIGHLFSMGPYYWTYFLGAFLLFGIASMGEYLLSPNFLNNYRIPWTGLFLIFEWHLVWAAGSGMETLLYAFIISLLFIWAALDKRTWPFYGILIGVSCWIRPDGIFLLAPFGLWLSFLWLQKTEPFGSFIKLLVGFLVIFLPYLEFNYSIAGSLLPTTFQAKQAEYAILRDLPLFDRLVDQLKLPFIGAGILLLPGLFFYTYSSYKGKKWGNFTGLLWAFGYLSLFAWRLPVTYQHGRYAIPAMLVLFICGLQGHLYGVKLLRNNKWGHVLSQAWRLSLACVLVVFWLKGAIAFSQDVEIINLEMVDVAHWINTNTESSSIIAAHDIGALGYFAHRNIIDLAGLITPDVIPFLGDEKKMGKYITKQGADYLVITFDWYPLLAESREILYAVDYPIITNQDYEHTKVYRWNIIAKDD